MDDPQSQPPDLMADTPYANPPATAATRRRTLPDAAILFAILSFLWGIINVLGAVDVTRTPAERIERSLEATINLVCSVGLLRLHRLGLYFAYLTSTLFALSGVSDFVINPSDPKHALVRVLIGLAWLVYFVVKRKVFVPMPKRNVK